ncbi:MAG: bifunctional glutamate N-acetyltransferase/amino-acid acetyltransferase ArgJ [Planctomycetaceae bacterium]|jgi:glutamate N-acetyltransferase/amino-acid N-acetyltransferase|nr:bifunctional glutamate N-acetyltransferase/amino-acid acetyltransferase ArgJ [Planctomycetaceae bacterium]
MPLPLAFRFAGYYAGLKSDPSQLDMAMIVSDTPATAAGVFTQNVVCGAPVTVARARIPSDDLRLVVVNTRVANTCTGEQGITDAKTMASVAASKFGLAEEQAIAMSTGVIGRMLPMEKILTGIDGLSKTLAANDESFQAAARGIMTTDLQPKFTTRELQTSSGKTIRIAGLCKGSGMIAPNMATMLAVITTDAALKVNDAQAMLKRVADVSFNCVTVDGDTSTSDMLVMLANGAADATPLTGNDITNFEKTLTGLCEELAKKIAADGEGASHLLTVEVNGCASESDAKQIARSIAESPLVKTAIAGGDPNWGRIMCAAGYAGINFKPEKSLLLLNETELFRNGQPVTFEASKVSKSIRENFETSVKLTLGEGNANAKLWTCDFTRQYIAINADYTS